MSDSKHEGPLPELDYDLSSLCGPADMRVVELIQSRRNHRFDPAYLEHVSRYHGGIPHKAYFTAANDRTYRVGRFLTLVDPESALSAPTRPSWLHPDRDIRIDWSVDAVTFEVSPTSEGLFYGEELLPFAALYAGRRHPDEMRLDGCDVDLLAFDFQSEPAGVVVWDSHRALDEVFRLEREVAATRGDPEPKVRTSDFTVPVAESFTRFLELLRRDP